MAGVKGIAGRKKKYSPETLKEEILFAINSDDKVVFMVDVYKIVGINNKLFDNYFPKGSADYEEIMEALNRNKGLMKKEIRDRLLGMNNPTALICLYKLLGTADERAALNNHKTKEETNTTDSNDITLEIQ